MQNHSSLSTPKQWALGALATTLSTAVLAHSYISVANAGESVGFTPNADQQLTTRQVATLLDRAHYLDEPLNQAMGAKALTMYLDTLDPNHTLFLQSDIDEFTQKYADNYAQRLKRGDLSAGIEIFERYRKRSNQYYQLARQVLAEDNLDLNTDKTIILDREDLGHFVSPKTQEDYWRNQTLFALIGITLGLSLIHI